MGNSESFHPYILGPNFPRSESSSACRIFFLWGVLAFMVLDISRISSFIDYYNHYNYFQDVLCSYVLAMYILIYGPPYG